MYHDVCAEVLHVPCSFTAIKLQLRQTVRCHLQLLLDVHIGNHQAPRIITKPFLSEAHHIVLWQRLWCEGFGLSEGSLEKVGNIRTQKDVADPYVKNAHWPNHMIKKNKAENVLWHDVQSRNIHKLLIHLLQRNFLAYSAPNAPRKLLPRIIFHQAPQLGSFVQAKGEVKILREAESLELIPATRDFTIKRKQHTWASKLIDKWSNIVFKKCLNKTYLHLKGRSHGVAQTRNKY